MNSEFQKLEALFKSDISSAIEECQKIIISVSAFDSYQDFYSYHLKNAHMSTCQNEWSERQLCIFCRNCANSDESCICLPCFLNGDHEGHDYIINKTTGNCDCGDQSHWKKCGFCSKHHGLEDNECPENYLDEKLRTTLTDVIFKASFSSLKHFTTDESENASKILQFVSSFLKFGDGFRRLISISLTERFDFKDLMEGIIGYSSDFNIALQQFCGGLTNDQLFIRHFSKISYDVIANKLLQDIPTIITGSENKITYSVWDRFWFHSFTSPCIQYNIEKFNWDWVELVTNSIACLKEFFKYVNCKDFNGSIPLLLITIINRMPNATNLQPNEQTQLYFDNIFNRVLSCGSTKDDYNDTIFVTSFNISTENPDYLPIHQFKVCFNLIFQSFLNKENLKFDSLFNQLDKSIDISPIFLIGFNSIGNGKENENDKFVARFIGSKEIKDLNASNYKSFHNGASFFLSFPLFDSLVQFYKIDEMTRIKIARFLSLKKFQNLRVKLGIVTMKSILSFFCSRQSIVPMKNISLNNLYSKYNNENMASKNYSMFVPLFQSLIGIQCIENSIDDEFSLKEFFAFELARELGVFDDFESLDYKNENVDEKQKTMLFSFLYLSLLFVTERKLYHFDVTSFVKEQIIFSLKKGIHSIDQLNELNDFEDIESDDSVFIFNELLMEVAETSKKVEKQKTNENENESDDLFKSSNTDNLYYLKDGIEYNYISAINSINDQMIIMNNQISKEPNKLLQIPQFEPEETFFFRNNENGLQIHLKQFLFTPTVLAIVYHTLRNGSSNPDLNDHLAMNILILISKFIDEEKESQQKNSSSLNESTEIHYDDLVDLIAKLKQNAFNYRIDENGNASIENTLNSTMFNSILNMKISSNDLPPKSFIDVLIEKGKLGLSVLHQMSDYVHIDSIEKVKNVDNIESGGKSDTKEANREKAAKLKEKIMNQYKDMIMNYNQQKGSDSIDFITSISNSNSIENEICSICSTYKKNEVFAYPLYIYRTKFPFIVDKPPLISKELEGIPVDCIINDFEKIETDEDDDDDDDEIDKDRIMAMIFSMFPNLQVTDGLNEEQLEQRLNIIRTLFKRIYSRVNEGRKNEKSEKHFKRDLKNYIEEEMKKFNKEMESKSFKRCTAGANFILQFNLCQHSVHPNCVKEIPFACPIDRSMKNCLLPSLEYVPKSTVFKDLKTFELKVNLDEINLSKRQKEDDDDDDDDENNKDEDDTEKQNKVVNDENALPKSIVSSILNFVNSFSSFFDCLKDSSDKQSVFIELIKSISGLISTFEIRLRSLPDCLDSIRTTLLSRNLFLTAWYAYRILGKPKIAEDDINSTISEKRLTVFQRLIKRLIESDEIELNDNKEETFKRLLVEFIQKEEKFNEINEKLICLFLRRSCLSEHYLLNIDVSFNSISGIIDWDEILSPMNLSDRYEFQFKTIDVKNGDEFDFKPFSMIDLPKKFFHLSLPPFNLPIQKVECLYFFNLFDCNYLINHYDEISGDIVVENIEDEIKKNQNNLFTCGKDEPAGTFFKVFFKSKYSPSVILFIGKFASNIILINGMVSEMSPFYLDKYGCTDIGYKRSQPLYLNEEKFEKCIDSILSGDFADAFK